MTQNRNHKFGRHLIALFLLVCMACQIAIPAYAVGEGTETNAVAAILSSAHSYADVPADAWYYTYVTELSEKGIIDGYPNGNFGPNDMVTIGAALKLILLAAGYEEQTPVNSHWSSGYGAVAVSEGLLTADQVSDLDSEIDRLSIAHLVANVLELSPSNEASPFSDTTDGYVTALYEQKIFEGTVENGTRIFMPDKNISRAEMSAIIWRISNLETNDSEKDQIHYGSYTVDVLEEVPVNSYDSSAFYFQDGVMHYNSSEVEARLGIDVSVFQGDIDWNKVKADGIDFAIIRVGGRGYTVGNIYDDTQFEKNIQGALAAGLDVGVYFFSQAITPQEAIEEANYVLDKIEGYNLTYPVVFDWEVIGDEDARTYGLDTETLCECAKVFCDLIADAGYTPMIYLTSYTGYIKYDLSQLLEYEFWFAEYNNKAPTFYYDFQMWQYSDSGSVDGISGDVDMNLYFDKK